MKSLLRLLPVLVAALLLTAPHVPTALAEAPATTSTEAASLQYVELLTGGAKATEALPLVIAIHGLGDRPEHFRRLVADLPVPARVIVPRAPDPRGGGYSWFPVRAKGSDPMKLSAGISKSGDRIAALVATVTRERPTAGRPVVLGFSQGGMLTFYLATHHPALFGAAIPVGGWLPPPLVPDGTAPKGAPRIVALHGQEDPLLLIGPTRKGVDTLKEKGWDVSLHEYPGVGHAIPPDMRAELHALVRAAVGVKTP